MGKKIIPFSWYPYTWGMAGKTREIAKAEYELTGAALKKRLLEIKKDEMNDDEYHSKLWKIEFENGELSENEYHRKLLSIMKDPVHRSLAELELDYRENKIPQIDYEKKKATIKGEPWVTVLNMDFNKKTSLEGSFELDWNEHFVEKLKAEGYSAPNDNLIVNQWFMEVCRNIALEEFDGVGDFSSDSEANLETFKRWTSSEPYSEGRKGYK